MHHTRITEKVTHLLVDVISRCSKLVYIIKKGAFYLLHFLPKHLLFLFILHYVPHSSLPTDKTSTSRIKLIKYKTKFEYLLGYMLSTSVISIVLYGQAFRQRNISTAEQP